MSDLGMTKPVFTAKSFNSVWSGCNDYFEMRNDDAAAQANARLAPLMAALERLDQYSIDESHSMGRAAALVQEEYRKLVAS